MNSDRIKEIQQTTAYPESVSVKQALLQVWNECEQEYRSQASDLPSDGITKFTEKEIDAAKSVRDSFLNQAGVERYKQVYMAGEIVMSDQLQPLLASHVARIKELEEEIKQLKLADKVKCDCDENTCCYYCEFEKAGTRNLTMPKD